MIPDPSPDQAPDAALPPEPKPGTVPSSDTVPTPAAPAPEPKPSKHPNIHTDVEVPADLESRVVDALRTVFDPEIPVNIYDLGLIYGIDLDEPARSATIRMTLTSPACPVAGTLPGEVELRVKELDELDEVTVELVWEPPWSKELLSEDAKILLGLV